MGHLLVLLVEFGRWLDKYYQKPLPRAIPDYERLLLDPRGTLAGQPVTIGPARRYGSAFLIGLLALVFGSVLTLCLVVLLVRPVAAGRGLALLLVPIALCAALVLLCLWLIVRLLRGAEMVLSEEGVELRYRGTEVACPWALFNVAGQPFQPRRDRVLVPVAAAAVPFVEARRHGFRVESGPRIRTPQLRFPSRTEALLRPLYEVPLLELGKLLLQLGRALGASLPETFLEPAAEAEPAPGRPVPAEALSDGWLTVRLTRLVFPPFCCDCGVPTERQQDFRGFATALRLGPCRIEGGEMATFRVPVCPACQKENQRVYEKSVFKGLVLGFAIPFGAALVLCLYLRNFAWLARLIALYVAGILVGVGIGVSRGRRRAHPVQLRDYAPGAGTIAIRFRWPEYGERLLIFLREQEEHPVEVITGRAAAVRG